MIAELNGRPIGFIQIIDPEREESHYWGDAAANLRAIDIWIGSETDLGKGYGTKMMALALARCFDNPSVSAVLVDPLASNTRSHRFYERIDSDFSNGVASAMMNPSSIASTVPTTCKPRTSYKRSVGRGNVTLQHPHETHLEEKP